MRTEQQANSMLTWEGEQHLGADAIVAKLSVGSSQPFNGSINSNVIRRVVGFLTGSLLRCCRFIR